MSSDPTQDHQPDPSNHQPSDKAPDGSKPTKPESNSELRHEMVERARQALEAIPEMIGPYNVIERLGAGGMGEVYRANQKSPIRRQVAVKLIKLGMDTRQVVARFEAERQALAMMDHPNIAKVFDGGTTADGRPYFVMEYVKGVPFTEYCDTAKLPLRERLKLFVPVCQAVQHAHQKGIVHRDLKPSNILICLYDGLPVPKVIDFGLAKALYQPLTDQSIYTTHGVMVGTPLYMSPEQAEQNNLDIDTRTDIYSLGVILYELLTGSTPLEREQLRAAAQHEVLRLIKEVDPPKPSTRLSGSASLPSVAAQRGIDPKQLSRSVSGDLDWIVMKALEKERSRRYATANGFAQDVERYLNDEAVEASPPSASYKLKRMLRKHRGAMFAVGLIILSLLSGTAISVYFALQANKAAFQASMAKGEAIDKANEAEARAKGERKEKELARQNLYGTHMLLAQSAWERADVVRLRELLDRYEKPPGKEKDLRSFEWHYLKGLAYADHRTLHGESIGTKTENTSVVFSQDGRFLAAGCSEGGVRIWEAGTGKVVTSLNDSIDWCVRGIALNPTRNQIVGLSRSGRLNVWDIGSDDAVCLFEPNLETSPGTKVGFCAAGKRLVSLWTSDFELLKSQVKVWDMQTGTELMAISTGSEKQEKIARVAISPDGQKLAIGKFGSDVVEICDVNTGQRILNLGGANPSRSYFGDSIAFSPDGSSVACACGDSAKIWDTQTGSIVEIFRGHEGEVSLVAFSSDGRRLATGSQDKTIRVWDIDSGREQLVLRGHDQIISGLAFSPDGWRLASVSNGGEVKVWNTGEATESFELSGHTQGLYSVEFSPNGRIIATSGDDETVRLWDASTDKLMKTLSGQGQRVTNVAFSPDSRMLAACGHEGLVKIWDTLSGSEITKLWGHKGMVEEVSFSPNGKWLASGGIDGVRVWDVNALQQVQCFECESSKFAGSIDFVNGIAFSQDSQRLATATGDGKIRIWDIVLGKQIVILEGHEWRVLKVAYSPNGQILASSGMSGTIRLWDTVTWKELRSLSGHSSFVVDIAFCADGRRIVSASLDGTVKLWDTATGGELLTLGRYGFNTLSEYSFGLTSVAVSPDDSRIALTSRFSRKVRIWHAFEHSQENNSHREARGLVQFLFGKGMERNAALDHLHNDLTISDLVRHEALQLAEHWQPDVDVSKLQADAWSKVHVPGAASDQYETALKQIESIYPLEPWNRDVLITLGVAQYRLGRYEEAMKSLLRAEELRPGKPQNIAFLAMAQYRLGKVDLAKKTLARMPDALKEDRQPNDNETMVIWNEAKSLLGENGPQVEGDVNNSDRK